ncbi:MAG: triose-phosphate isomerase, partial [Chloroflexi bacterium]
MVEARGHARKPTVGGNWKMNTTLETAVALAESLVRSLGQTLQVDVVLCPPFPNLEAVYRTLEGSTLRMGGQDVFWEDAGAYTGEVSAPMLVAIGCSWVIVGHSERRRLLGESSEIVNRKLHATLRNDLNAILAIGETYDERHAGQTEQVLEEQLRDSLAGVSRDQMPHIVIAYEPVWAIGTGETASPEQAQDAHVFARRLLAHLIDEEVAATTRIQYGGSVTSSNAAALMSQPDVDGALVGGA